MITIFFSIQLFIEMTFKSLPLVFIVLWSSHSHASPDERRLLHDLLLDYNPLERPVIGKTIFWKRLIPSYHQKFDHTLYLTIWSQIGIFGKKWLFITHQFILHLVWDQIFTNSHWSELICRLDFFSDSKFLKLLLVSWASSMILKRFRSFYWGIILVNLSKSKGCKPVFR